ncbi:hypothetical protein PSAL_032880 [Pseudooceanicola algae]|uniref:Uncharacterized protein n=2 Tax=Pseudooceanicola algae TaxID=1537215 RepID=A0A418SL86_9RHOB|nr:hypothetical protein PSAL_032880 [Pseudooceanicola algae]
MQRASPSLRTLIELYLSAFRAVHRRPDPAQLKTEAPCLANWTVATRGREIFLVGDVTGHPLLGDSWIQTSTLIFVSEDRQWARTLSRWYRLRSAFVPPLPDEYAGVSLRGYLVSVDDGIISLPMHMARKFMVRRPQEVADLAFSVGYDDLVPELTRLARAWPNMPNENLFQVPQAL